MPAPPTPRPRPVAGGTGDFSAALGAMVLQVACARVFRFSEVLRGGGVCVLRLG
uniref:Uncharacterized protein n=1 Tax=Arundo donax TaxID=35708 RepID=A0A0A9EP99_ARUDO